MATKIRKNVQNTIENEKEAVEKEFQDKQDLTPTFFRYAKKLTLDATFSCFLIFLMKHYSIWEKYILSSSILNNFTSTISWYLPTSLLSIEIISRIFSWLNSEAFLFVILSLLVHEITYLTWNLFFSVIETFGILSQYKLQFHDDIPRPSRTLIRKTKSEIFIQHFIWKPILFLLIYPFFQYFGSEMYAPIPSLISCFISLLGISFLTDLLYYALHRSAHTHFYHLHKKHHQYKRTISISSDYSSFIESITLNILPTIIGPMLLGSHYSIWLAWLAYRTYSSIESHSGYILPLINYNSHYNAYHHLRNDGNYGINDFWDSLFRTNTSYSNHFRNNNNYHFTHIQS